MHYKIIFLFFTFIFMSCLPPASIQKSSEIAILELNKDIHVYNVASNSFLDIDTPNIYRKDKNLYFGSFYYATANSIYAIDSSRSNIVVASIDKNKSLIQIPNTNIYSIDLVDSYSNIYFTTEDLSVKEIVETFTKVVENEVFDPDNITDDLTVKTSQSRIVTITRTNYVRTGVVFLNKISPEGKNIFNIIIAKANELNSNLKIMQMKDDSFSVFRTTTNTSLIDIYDSLSLEKTATHDIQSLVSQNAKELAYKRIIDVSYMKESDVFLILTTSVENGKIVETLVHKLEVKTGNLSKLFTLNLEALPITINSQGTIIATGVDDIKHYIIKVNPFVSRTTYKSYINTPDIRGIKIFNGELFGFREDDNKIIFYLIS